MVEGFFTISSSIFLLRGIRRRSGGICHGHFRLFTGTFSKSFTGQCQIFTAIISEIVTGIVAKVMGISSKKAVFAKGFNKKLPVNL